MDKITTTSSSWKNYQKIAFRFVLIFFFLFIIFLDWSVNPILSQLYYYGPLSTLLDNVISWVAKDIFHIQNVIISPYDGEHNDRTYVYVLYFTMAVLAVVGTITWSLLDRKRKSHNVLYYWLTAVMRYYLAFTMFLFGLYKFFKLQFPDLDYYTLTTQVGDMSPMHLAWAFFGHSYEYNVFMGIAECASLLLLFRRTTTLGALITMGTLANVIAVNYSYDVHAKLYPTALFLIALFLFIKDAKPLFRFFFSGQAIALPAIQAPIFSKRWMQTAKTVLKIIVIGYFLIFAVKGNSDYIKQSEESYKAKSKYSGVYDVESFVVNHDTIPMKDPSRWHQIIIDGRVLEAVRFKGDSVGHINVLVEKKELRLYGEPVNFAKNRQEVYNEKGMTDDTWMKMDSILIARQKISSFQFEMADSTSLELKGTIENDSVFITAKRLPIDINDFRLMKSRFHWINEASYFY
nr:hypothetical protein [Allomuricauda sp.]